MIRLLYTLPEEMKRKHIYIWDISKDSIVEFTKLAMRLIDIKGFVTQEESYIGEWYMNRPIVGIETVLKDKDTVIFLSSKYDRSKIPDEINQRALLISDVLQPDEELRNKRVFIYGAGGGGRSVYAEFIKSGINMEAFCVTERNGQNTIESKAVYQINEIERKEEDAFIISVLNEEMKQEIVDILDAYNANMYIRNSLSDDDIFAISLFQTVHEAWQKNKKIYIYTKKMGGYAQLIKAVLELYGMHICGYVCRESDENTGIRNVYELTYENTGDLYVLINDLDILEREQQVEIYTLLDDIGLSLQCFNYAGFGPVTTIDWRNCYQIKPDPLLGWSIIYDDENLPGVHVIGSKDKDSIRILILGASVSTDGILRPISWVRLFYQKLTEQGFKVTIYDCAGPSEDVLQELLRLIRDGVHLNAQYIISMSGGNNAFCQIKGIKNRVNLKHTIEWYKVLAPDSSYVHGIPVKESAFTYWIRIQKIIKAVAELNGSKYYCFLHPIKDAKENLSIFERSIHFSGDADNEAFSFREESRQDDFYVNLLSLFDEKEGMFIDNCHFSERGNEILAEIVSKKLLKDLSEERID